MIRHNPTRKNFAERFQQLIDDYNHGAVTIDEFFRRLTQFAAGLTEKDQRGIRQGLDEEELALFDLLTRPGMKLSAEEEAQVREPARSLLATLKQEKLVLDWRKHQQSRAGVQVTIENVLDEGLPDPYTTEIYEQKCALVYQHRQLTLKLTAEHPSAQLLLKARRTLAGLARGPDPGLNVAAGKLGSMGIASVGLVSGGVSRGFGEPPKRAG